VSWQKLNVGDKVEYVDSRFTPTGVVGVVTGFYEKDRVFVLCPSGHHWALRVSSLKKVSSKKKFSWRLR
jgi:hypothetical protein